MTQHLMTAFQIDGAKLGTLAAAYFYAYLLMQIPAGLLIDRIGPRLMTTVAILCCAIGSLLFGMAHTFFAAMVGRFLTGIGASFAVINCLKLIANWFPHSRFATMAGLMMTVGMLGAVGGQAPLAAYIEAMGWREAFSSFSIFGIILSGIFWVFVRDHHDPVRAHHHKKHPTRFKTILSSIVTSRQSWILSIYSGLAFAPVSVFGGLWGVPFFMASYATSHTQAARLVSLIFLGFALGAPISGWFSDRIKSRKNVMLYGTIVALVSLTIILYVPNLGWGVLSGLLFLFGVSMSCFLVCFTMIRELHRPIMAATAVGFMNSFDAFFGAFSDPMIGFFLDLGWVGTLVNGARIFTDVGYRQSLIALPVYLIISIGLIFFIKETYRKGGHSSPDPFP